MTCRQGSSQGKVRGEAFRPHSRESIRATSTESRFYALVQLEPQALHPRPASRWLLLLMEADTFGNAERPYRLVRISLQV